jgi:hypothetical protein
MSSRRTGGTGSATCGSAPTACSTSPSVRRLFYGAAAVPSRPGRPAAARTRPAARGGLGPNAGLLNPTSAQAAACGRLRHHRGKRASSARPRPRLEPSPAQNPTPAPQTPPPPAPGAPCDVCRERTSPQGVVYSTIYTVNVTHPAARRGKAPLALYARGAPGRRPAEPWQGGPQLLRQPRRPAPPD